MQEIKKILSEISKISNKYQQLSELSGNNFNVFSVINVTKNEVRLHSRFLAELLNRKGSHGQGDVFLNLFINRFKISMDTATAEVKVEKYIGKKTKIEGGYIDIFIKDKKGNSITIENKIYAPDQENQLLRYFNFNQNNLFYLTLFGDEPTSNSYEFDDDNKLNLEKDVTLISYKDDIKDWLIDCRKEAVEYPLLREGISHYINLIETLTGQSSNDIMNDEIRDFIAKNPENLKQAALIEESLIDAKIKVQWLFWQNLKDKLISADLNLLDEKSVTWQNIKNYYAKSRNRDKYYGYWIKIFEKEDISIHFGIEIENDIYFGFTMERNGKGNIAFKEENSKYRNLVLNINHNYKTTNAWLGYRNLDERLDFRAFNSEAVFQLADRKKLDKKTDKIVSDIITDIKTLKNKLENL